MQVDLSRDEINRLCRLLRKQYLKTIRDNDRDEVNRALMRDFDLVNKLIAAKAATGGE